MSRDAAGLRARYRAGDRRRHERFSARVWLVMRKDLLVELRSREILYTTLFFAVSCVLVFAFGFVQRRAGRRGRGAPASCGSRSRSRARWRSGRTFERERQSETLRALLMAPVDRAGRSMSASCSASLMLLAAVEAAARAARRADVPGAAVRAPAADGRRCSPPARVGFAAVGTLFAAMLVRARSRDVLLPILLYPITVPVIIAGVRGTAALLQRRGRS